MRMIPFYIFVFIIGIVGLAIQYLAIPLIIFLIGVGIYHLAINIYIDNYFSSEEFLVLKSSIKDNATKCNELNAHIEELKKTYTKVKSGNYGNASYYDNNSNYDFKRPNIEQMVNNNSVHNCSLSVCRGAKNQPFKYFCKYFNVKADEETLSKFEEVFNNFSAVEQGKKLLKQEREEIIQGLSNKIPELVYNRCKNNRLMDELGFTKINFNELYCPKYSFVYVSAGGNSSMRCDIVFNVQNLERFINYLAGLIEFRNSIAGQRALMTSTLREKIKERDNFTCKHCGVSVKEEPHLLLEIDHIIPLSKGGITSEKNLQTLCWRCNRAKGNKILEKTNNN